MPNFDSKATFEANVLLPKWCSKWCAFLLLRVYSILRAASEYPQTGGLDYLSAWSMVQCAKEALKKIQFDEVHEKTSCYIFRIKDKVDTLGVTLENTRGEKSVEKETDTRGTSQRFCITGCRIYRIHIFQQLSINHVYIYSLLVNSWKVFINYRTQLLHYFPSIFLYQSSIFFKHQSSLYYVICLYGKCSVDIFYQHYKSVPVFISVHWFLILVDLLKLGSCFRT